MWAVDKEIFDEFCESLAEVVPRFPILLQKEDGRIYFLTDYICDFNGNFHSLYNTVFYDLYNLEGLKSSLYRFSNKLLDLQIEILDSTPFDESLVNYKSEISNSIIKYSEEYIQRSLALGINKCIYFNDTVYDVLKLLSLSCDEILNKNFNYLAYIKFFILSSYLYVYFWELPNGVDVNKFMTDYKVKSLKVFTFENYYNYIKELCIKSLDLN